MRPGLVRAVWTLTVAGVLSAGCDEEAVAPTGSGRIATQDVARPDLAVVVGSEARLEIVAELQVEPIVRGEEDRGIEIRDMNRSGAVVGLIGDHAVVWSAEGVPTELPVPPDGSDIADVEAINDVGEVTGSQYVHPYSRALVWSGGQIVMLPPLPGHAGSVAYDINNAGDVVGSSYSADYVHAAVVWREGEAIDLAPAAGDEEATATLINDSGLILGYSPGAFESGGTSGRFAVWDDDVLVWADLGQTISAFWYHWWDVTDAGAGYMGAGSFRDSVYVWENGQAELFRGGDPTFLRAVSPDGLVLGTTSGVFGTWGVWTQDGVFHPFSGDTIRYCEDMAEGGWVACVTPSDARVLARFHLDDEGETPSSIESLLAFFDGAVADGSLVGTGAGESTERRLDALRNQLQEAGAMIEAGAAAADICGQLGQVLVRTDGSTSPPDFVAGPASATLANEVDALMDELACA